jgi:molybdate transport system substrate-binding protein
MAKDIILLSGGAADGLVSAVTPAFRAETGAGVQGTFGAVGAMREKLRQGHPADMLILTRPIIDELASAGDVDAGSVTDIGQVRTAIAVRAGDPVPGVDSADALRTALLAADEIHFPDPALATAGIHFAKVLDRLGIADRVAGALRVHPNGATAMRALATSGARLPIGCTQVTEIIITPGAMLVAPLPEGLGLSTTYTAAVCRGAANDGLARSFVARLGGAGLAEERRKAGFE